MRNGDIFVMTIPKAPYRCPPGPYERACVVADYLKTAKGPNCKVIVLDENLAIQAEKHTFETGLLADPRRRHPLRARRDRHHRSTRPPRS